MSTDTPKTFQEFWNRGSMVGPYAQLESAFEAGYQASQAKQFSTNRVSMPAVLFNDPRVQIVYELLCDGQFPDNSAEHWEGWIARRIVGALSTAPAPADGPHVDAYRKKVAAQGHVTLPDFDSLVQTEPSDAQAGDGMCGCRELRDCKIGTGKERGKKCRLVSDEPAAHGWCGCTDGCADEKQWTRNMSTRCRIAAGQPFVEESAGPVATRSGWFDRGRLQGLKEAAESVRDAWAKHAGKSFDQKFPSTTHECPKCKGFVESLEAIAALSSKPDEG